MSDSTFTGFGTDAASLLDAMPGWTRDDYATRKPEVVDHLVDPAKAFVDVMVDELRAKVSPGIDGAPKINGSISPLNNDTRFSRDKSLYKDHLLLWFWEGPSKKAGAKLALRIGSSDVGFASGMPFDPAQLQRWREAIADDAASKTFVAVLDKLRRSAEVDVVGQELKRVPKPYDPDHPRADLLRHKGFQVRWPEPAPASFTSAEFVTWCAQRLQGLKPVHRFLVDHVV